MIALNLEDLLQVSIHLKVMIFIVKDMNKVKLGVHRMEINLLIVLEVIIQMAYILMF